MGKAMLILAVIGICVDVHANCGSCAPKFTKYDDAIKAGDALFNAHSVTGRCSGKDTDTSRRIIYMNICVTCGVVSVCATSIFMMTYLLRMQGE